MMNRCYTTTNKDYPSIGGKGITVCPEWHTYENFFRDMGEKPANSQLSRYCDGLGFTKDNTYWLERVNVKTNRLYSIWKGIRRRCGIIGNRHNASHETYKTRGVIMSPDWEQDFHKFAADIGQPPSDAHSLDRIDNNMGYYPDNVRWVLPKEQANNRCDNVVIEIHGERHTLQEWGDIYGISSSVIHGRWASLFKPAKRKNQRCVQCTLVGDTIREFAGVKEAANLTGIRQGTIAKCLSGGNASAGGYTWRYAE